MTRRAFGNAGARKFGIFGSRPLGYRVACRMGPAASFCESRMRRRQRLKLARLALAALTAAAIAATLVPAGGALPARAASAADRPVVPAQLSHDELVRRAARAADAAGKARALADKARIAAQSADATHRQAETNLAIAPATASTGEAGTTIPRQQQDYAIAAAQSRLQQAQQNEQLAELRANTIDLGASTTPAAGNPAGLVLGNTAQVELQNARAAVLAAQQDLAAARQSASMANQSAAFAGASRDATVRDAERALTTARRLAAAAARAAAIAETNAQTLAESAERARKATGGGNRQ
jgi:hypothetical protein